MRSTLRSVLVTPAVVVALGAVGTASASAHEFEYSHAGNLKHVSNTTQTLTTKAGGPVVECTTDTVKGVGGFAGNFKTQKVELGYSGCKVKFSLFTIEATVSNASYLFNAEGTVTLENKVTVSVPIAGCTITVPAQENLKPVAYENTPAGDLTFNMKFEKIKSVGSGGECGTGENTTGVYAGKTAVSLEGGTIDWT